MYAQAGLRLCCSQTPEDRVSRVEAHICFVSVPYAFMLPVKGLSFMSIKMCSVLRSVITERSVTIFII